MRPSLIELHKTTLADDYAPLHPLIRQEHNGTLFTDLQLLKARKLAINLTQCSFTLYFFYLILFLASP